jgi:hypothetical protein
LVPYELVPVGDDAYPYQSDSLWAQPDIAFAARALRELSIDLERRIKIGNKARQDVTSEFTMDKASEFVLTRVKQLHKGLIIQIPTKVKSQFKIIKQVFLKIKIRF